MRFMMIVKGSKDSEAGVLPTEAHLAAMGKYNEELQKAGVLLDMGGLKPTSRGVKVRFSGGKRTVVDGPFAEAKEIVGGYWIIQVKSKEEAIEWAKRIPAEVVNMPEVELRPFYEFEDFISGPALEAAKEFGKKLPGNAGHKG
ncbi:MAG TPA: YciI family protein [Polyangia bacterium]|nr:YciI family protein [Polyangia bacterium]